MAPVISKISDLTTPYRFDIRAVRRNAIRNRATRSREIHHSDNSYKKPEITFKDRVARGLSV